MKHFKTGLLILLPLMLLFLAPALHGSGATDDSIGDKEEITIVITDSGLGGLAVMEDIASRISRTGQYKKVNLFFVNALFEAGRGYNALPHRAQKIEIFNKVLFGIEKHYDPDMILIACNTLSVLYRDTPFEQQSLAPVVGIVESGVSMIEKALVKDTSAVVIITGTETTISESNHKQALLDAGITANRIVTQACPQLQSYIEQDPMGEDTEMLIAFYMEEAISQVPENHGPVYLSLNCTHFGYADPLWRKSFEFAGCELAGILNPNLVMADFILKEKPDSPFPQTEIKLKVVSKVEILNKDSMVRLFNDSSPELSNALNNYDIVRDLF